MNRSAIILAGGASTRFGEDKGVQLLASKPLIWHVANAVRSTVDETIIVTSSEERAAKYAKLLGGRAKFAVDVFESKSPLIGALTGFGIAGGEYSLLLPFDTPFVSKDVTTLLFELCINKAAAIPRWPNGHIEPLHAVYHTRTASDAARRAIDEGRLDMRAMIERMRGVRFVSTLVMQQLDPDLKTFFNINTPLDLKRAEKFMRTEKTA